MANLNLVPQQTDIHDAATRAADRAVKLGGYMHADPNTIRTEIRKSRTMFLVGLISGIGTIGYIRWGPTPSGEEATFCVFLLLVSCSLVTIGVLTGINPLWTAIVAGRLDAIQTETRLFEAESDLANVKKSFGVAQQDLSFTIGVIDEVKVTEGSQLSTLAVIQRHESKLQSIRAQLPVPRPAHV